MTTYTLDAQDATGADLDAPATSNVAVGAAGVPPAIAHDEIGYWTMKWRMGDKESEAARLRGESRVFDSNDPNDVIRWLLSDD